MIFNVSGGGGTALNFRVVGNPKPSTDKENTIWIDTDVPITSYIFSATQPTGVPGMVWISTDTSSTVAFNALKKNGIQVYPISAKQYVSGKWVDKTAKSWQGGKWVSWIRYLYNYGDTCDAITGGWDKSNSNAVLNVYDTYMDFKSNTVDTWRYLSTKKKVNLTNYNVLHCELEFTGDPDTKSYARIGYGSTNTEAASFKGNTPAISKQKEHLTVDISGVSGEYYILVGSQAVTTFTRVYSVWLT